MARKLSAVSANPLSSGVRRCQPSELSEYSHDVNKGKALSPVLPVTPSDPTVAECLFVELLENNNDFVRVNSNN